jgi:hypothetical protein
MEKRPENEDETGIDAGIVRAIVRDLFSTIFSRTGKPVATRNWSILVLLVWLANVGGCAVLPDPVRTSSLLMRHRALSAGSDSQVVQLDVALLERPLGDSFLNQELWQHTDEMIVDMDRKAAVEDNGFRVGQIVGMTPGKLHDLLTSPRYCINPKRRLVPSGHTVPQFLGPVWPHCDFVVQQGRQTLEVALDQARFCLDVKATLTEGGKTRLSFTPKVENGENALPFQPEPEQSAWTIRVEKPCKTYKELGWDVVLAPGEYLVIGAVLQKERSLGYRAFVQEDGNPVQRLLVLRTSRSQNGGDTGEPTLEDIARSRPSPCLALQATMTAVRASGE